MSNIINRIGNLITIKSLVTLILTICFVILSLRGTVSSEMFMTIFSMCIAFYFGTSKRDDTGTDK